MPVHKTRKLKTTKSAVWVSPVQSAYKKKLEKFAGKWIAVSNGDVLADGKSVREVMDKIKRKKVQTLPLVVKQPKKSDGWYVL